MLRVKGTGDKITGGTGVNCEVEGGFFGKQSVLETVAAGGFGGEAGVHAGNLVKLAAPLVGVPGIEASVGVSVLPSSVMSGAFFPLVSAFVQSEVALVHGIQTTLTAVLASAG